MTDSRREHGQWFTPIWAAEALVERYFPWLSSADLVVEPTCGEGAFLRAIRSEVPAIVVEIDRTVAERARESTGREIIVGDFRTVQMTCRPTAIIGNPPFKLGVVTGILKRCFELLPAEGMAGFILPAYMLNNPSIVVQHAARWALQCELIPRNLFQSLTTPLVFALFRKSEHRIMVGLALFEEARDIEQMPAPYREILRRGRGSVWLQVVSAAIDELNGEAGLDAIYGAVAPRRPTENPYWRDKVRQVLQKPPFVRIARGRYSRAGEQHA